MSNILGFPGMRPENYRQKESGGVLRNVLVVQLSAFYANAVQPDDDGGIYHQQQLGSEEDDKLLCTGNYYVANSFFDLYCLIRFQKEY